MASQNQKDRRDVEILAIALAVAIAFWSVAVRIAITIDGAMPPPADGDNASALYKIATQGKR